jgi:hypothetical protein
MSGSLLAALVDQGTFDNMGIKSDFTFQHRLCHDLESLIWVVVYAMMIRRRNLLAATDPKQSVLFQGVLDRCWGVHSYSHLWDQHGTMMNTGCSVRVEKRREVVVPRAARGRIFPWRYALSPWTSAGW